MNPLIEIAQTVATGGAATAVIIVVRMFLAHLREERLDREKSRRQFLEVITNDLAHQRAAVGDLTAVIAELNAHLRAAAPIDRRAPCGAACPPTGAEDAPGKPLSGPRSSGPGG